MKLVAKPVDMIATFGKRSTPKPYKFRYEDRNYEKHIIIVDQILCVEKRHIAGMDAIHYTCQSEISGVLRMYELKYIINQYRWELFKI